MEFGIGKLDACACVERVRVGEPDRFPRGCAVELVLSGMWPRSTPRPGWAWRLPGYVNFSFASSLLLIDSDVVVPMQSESIILRNRIKFAVRRSTGLVVDMDAMLGRPELRAPRIRAWRQIGSPDLNQLLDQLESEFQQDPGKDAKAVKSIAAGRGAIWLVPTARA